MSVSIKINQSYSQNKPLFISKFLMAIVIIIVSCNAIGGQKMMPPGPIIYNPPTSICSNKNLPAGFVITSVDASLSQSCHPYSKWYISYLSSNVSNISVCSHSAKLSGDWIYTKAYTLSESTGQCGPLQMFSLTNESGVNSSVNTCLVKSELPFGWAVTSVSKVNQNGNCAQFSPGIVIRLNNDSPVASICAVTIPKNWMPISIEKAPNTVCNQYQKFEVRYALSKEDGFWACGVDNTKLPTGWVITKIQSGLSGGGCANFQPEFVRRVTSNQASMLVCAPSPVPVNWTVDRVNPYPGEVPCSQYTTKVIKQDPSLPPPISF